MTRARRPTLFAALALLPSVAVLTYCLSSDTTLYFFFHRSPGGVYSLITLYPTALGFGRSTRTAAVALDDREPVPASHGWGHFECATAWPPPPQSLANRVGFYHWPLNEQMVLQNDESVAYDDYVVPLWLATFVLGIPSLWYLGRVVRRHRRAVRRLCLACGYDLRATPERCPECGTEQVVQ